MVEQILPGMYRMEIPLPRSPLKAINSYLVKGQERCLVIDTGMNREECMHEMRSCLGMLNVDLEKTDFFITHLHADHLGLVGDLATDTSKVYFNRREVTLANPGEEYWRQLSEVFKSHGFPEEELGRAMKRHPGRIYGLKRHVDFCLLKEDDVIDVGDYSFRCIETPGHTPGHMCLYEADKKILVCGDHILFDITPNITTWRGMRNPLGQYLASLDQVYSLDVNLVLPGHRRTWNNHRRRIAELKEHHRGRLAEVLRALEDGEKAVFEIAPWVTWDIKCSSWESFPPTQKIFAVGETLAHLEYFEEQGVVRRRTKEDKILFSLS
ncbi:MAG: MBL fold metallo-hydrolase [Dehalococcoidia bacterium]|nr:MBL fold metallo-hydrolase [Dehalococcoidia bacterium]